VSIRLFVPAFGDSMFGRYQLGKIIADPGEVEILGPHASISPWRFQSVMATHDQLFEGFARLSPVERLAWSAIQSCRYSIKFFLSMQGQVGAFREVLPEQSVGIGVS
jgi:hypothetical protein